MAQRFHSALQEQDGAGACALLSPETRSELEKSSGTSCAKGLLEERIPAVESAERVSVFGTMGQVRYEGETTYLARFGDRWLVIATGCIPARVGPDDCTVKGG